MKTSAGRGMQLTHDGKHSKVTKTRTQQNEQLTQYRLQPKYFHQEAPVLSLLKRRVTRCSRSGGVLLSSVHRVGLQMKSFTVRASYKVHCTATIEANNEAEAYAIAQDMDGGSFHQDDNDGLSNWSIDSCDEATR